MSPTARRSLIAMFVILSVIGLLRSCGNVHELRPSTRTTTPWGFGAFYELCERLWPETARVNAIETPPIGWIWWIPRHALCANAPNADPWALRSWVEAGGRAVVALTREGGRRCRLDDDLALPHLARRPAKSGMRITGAAPDTAHHLPHELTTFRAVSSPWTTLVRIGDAPFVIERSVGLGRVAVIADGRFLTNEWLADGDAAPLAAALAARWGPPAFDDGTATRPVGGPVAFVAHSPGILPLAMLAIAGLLVVWHGRLIPARAVPPDVRVAPRTDEFVRSFGRLLARSRDRAGLLASYQAWGIATIAPRLGLSAHASAADVVARLRVARGDAEAALFEVDAVPTNAAELERRLALLTAVVEEVTA